MARAALGWSTQDLATKAEVGVNTVNRFEAGQDARMSTVEKMRDTFDKAGVLFIEANGGGPGVRLKAPPAAPAEEPAPTPKPRKRKASPEDPPAS